MADRPTPVIDRQYRVIRTLGHGPYATVHEAVDPDGETVAVKLFDPRVRHDPLFTSFFRRDARAIQSLTHRQIVSPDRYGVSHGSYYAVMSVVHGRPLGEVSLSPDPVLAAAVGADAAHVLDVLHRHDVVHGGIRPSNLFLSDNELVVTLSAGRHSVIDTAAPELEHLVVSYLSPEQVAGRPVGPPSDIFSLGIVMYQLATGVLPFESSSTSEAAKSRMAGSLAPLSQHVSTVPEPLNDLVVRCLSVDPDARPRAGDLGAELDALRLERLSADDRTEFIPIRAQR